MQLNGKVFTYKFNSWRQFVIKRFVKVEGNLQKIEEIEKALSMYDTINLLVWSVRQQYELPDFEGLNVISVEDGFIRSVGLGAEHTIPISLVFDKKGIYFDATRESDLEMILCTLELDHTTSQVADELIELVKKNRINKYNLEERPWKVKTNKKIIIVPGQVEHDKSIIYGSPVIKDNLSLLRNVRIQNPDSYVVFKIHPDISRKCRINKTKKSEYFDYADEVIENISTFSLIERADEVHTITSLFGFESLLFGKRVICYGQPFYSGWGLTEDKYPIPRRNKRLSIKELIFGAYYLYPTYVSLISSEKIDAIEAITEITKIKYNRNLMRLHVPLKERLVDSVKKTLITIREFLVNGTFKRV